MTERAGGKVLVERLQDNGNWKVWVYRLDPTNVLVEVRPNGSLLPMGPGLVHSAKDPLVVVGSLLDTILAELCLGSATPADPTEVYGIRTTD